MTLKKLVIIIDKMNDSLSFCEQGVELELAFDNLASDFGEGILPVEVIGNNGDVIGHLHYEDYGKKKGMFSIIIDDEGKIRNISISDRFYEMKEETQRDMMKCMNFPCHKKWDKK